MNKKLIAIENGEYFQYDKLEDLAKDLIDDSFYEMSQEERINKIHIKALANKLERNNIISIKDEKEYILHLLVLNRIILLERIDSEIFIKDIDKSKIKDNYIVVNTFAQKLLSNINE